MKTATELNTILKTHNLKITKSRLEVLKVLKQSPNPLTPSEIMEKLDGSQNWDRVTIYRTLGEFAERKIVKSILNMDRVTYFELVDSHPEHAHLSCLECGKMECLEENEYKFILENSKGFEIRSIEILLKGICRECR
ncbi:MAG: transcriptional repressor [Leptospiraceae bacterium]|nr:transcriptional repressor [Leptospiraceae bacterium]